MRVQAMTIPALAGRATRGAPPARRMLAALTILARFRWPGSRPGGPRRARRPRSGAGDPLHGAAQGRLRPWRRWPAASGASAGPAGWRSAVYVAGPPLMALGAAGLWSLRDPGLAALGLHLGLFAILAAALTDREALPDRPRAARRQIVS
ncbi:hypothetical protein ACU4GA_23585 [Methylobacterium oryzae CBMB20]